MAAKNNIYLNQLINICYRLARQIKAVLFLVIGLNKINILETDGAEAAARIKFSEILPSNYDARYRPGTGRKNLT